MHDLIHEPARRAGCRLVVSGHAHNYQRFAHDSMTYIVNGAGGYFELHDLAPATARASAPHPIVAHARDHSFVHLTVTPEALTLRAIAVPLPSDPDHDATGALPDRPCIIEEHRIPIAGKEQ